MNLMTRLTLVTLTFLGAVGCDPGTGPSDAGVDAGGQGGDAGPRRLNGAGQAVVPQNGRFVVAGAVSAPGGDWDLLVARYDADGGLDPTFGDGGAVITQFGTYIDPVVLDAGFLIEQKAEAAFAVTLQGTKVLVAGTAQSQGLISGAYALARYSADGQPDPTFGVDGRALVRLGLGGPAHALAVRSDGKVYVGGFVRKLVGTDLGLARFSADGVIDPGFGSATGVTADFGKNEDVRGLGFQGLKVLAGGGDDFAVARFNDDGSLDSTFGVAGVAKSEGGTAHNFRVLSDGRLLLSGTRRLSTTDPSWVVKLVRYTAAGALDPSFGTGGVLETALDGHQVSTTALEVLSDGRIVTQQVALTSGGNVIAAVARFTGTGAVDTTFGTGGVLSLDVFLTIIPETYPLSANRSVVVGDRLYFTDVDVTRLVFGSVAVR
jgi:uncharacterized delta-60 repeat protein